MPTPRKTWESRERYHARLKNESKAIKRKLLGRVVWHSSQGTLVGRIKKTYRAQPRSSTRVGAVAARSLKIFPFGG